MSFTVSSNTSNIVARLDKIDDEVAARLEERCRGLHSELLGKIKALTPVRSGALQGSIEGRVVSGPSGTLAEVSANPTGGASHGSRRSYYALWVEYGTKLRRHKTPPSAKPIGKVTAVHFMHGPFAEMRDRIDRELKEAIEGTVQ